MRFRYPLILYSSHRCDTTIHSSYPGKVLDCLPYVTTKHYCIPQEFPSPTWQYMFCNTDTPESFTAVGVGNWYLGNGCQLLPTARGLPAAHDPTMSGISNAFWLGVLQNPNSSRSQRDARTPKLATGFSTWNHPPVHVYEELSRNWTGFEKGGSSSKVGLC